MISFTKSSTGEGSQWRTVINLNLAGLAIVKCEAPPPPYLSSVSEHNHTRNVPQNQILIWKLALSLTDVCRYPPRIISSFNGAIVGPSPS